MQRALSASQPGIVHLRVGQIELGRGGKRRLHPESSQECRGRVHLLEALVDLAREGLGPLGVIASRHIRRESCALNQSAQRVAIDAEEITGIPQPV
jgi:hypothetical protein